MNSAIYVVFVITYLLIASRRLSLLPIGRPAGNFTLIGSVANIIVAERARDSYTLGFFEYLRFGLPSTILVLVAGVTIISFVMRG